MLNELFMAEKDASKTSTYQMTVDGIKLGRFKSSGVIVSTGTGSSGWLYGAKRVTNTNVKDIARELLDLLKKENCEITEKLKQTTEDNQFVEILANQMSKETHFTSESKKMYYYVREAYKETSHNEGFASTVKLESELSDG